MGSDVWSGSREILTPLQTLSKIVRPPVGGGGGPRNAKQPRQLRIGTWSSQLVQPAAHGRPGQAGDSARPRGQRGDRPPFEPGLICRPANPHVRLSGVRRVTHGSAERRVVGRRRCPRGHDAASPCVARRRPARVARRAVYAGLREFARLVRAELLAAHVDLDWRGRYARWWRSARDASQHMVRLPRGGCERRVAARDGVAACGACAGRHVGLRAQDVGGSLRRNCRQGGVARADR